MDRRMDRLPFTSWGVCNKWEYDQNLKLWNEMRVKPHVCAGRSGRADFPRVSRSSAPSSPAPVSLLTFSCLSQLLACQQTFGIQHLRINYELEESLVASLNHSTQFPLSCLLLCPPVTSAADSLFTILPHSHTLSCLVCVHTILLTPACVCGPLSRSVWGAIFSEGKAWPMHQSADFVLLQMYEGYIGFDAYVVQHALKLKLFRFNRT